MKIACVRVCTIVYLFSKFDFNFIYVFYDSILNVREYKMPLTFLANEYIILIVFTIVVTILNHNYGHFHNSYFDFFTFQNIFKLLVG